MMSPTPVRMTKYFSPSLTPLGMPSKNSATVRIWLCGTPAKSAIFCKRDQLTCHCVAVILSMNICGTIMLAVLQDLFFGQVHNNTILTGAVQFVYSTLVLFLDGS